MTKPGTQIQSVSYFEDKRRRKIKAVTTIRDGRRAVAFSKFISEPRRWKHDN